MTLVVLAMLPMLGLLLYHSKEDRDRETSRLEDEAFRMAELSAGSVSQVLEGARQMLHSLAYTEQVRTMNGESASALFSDVIKNYGLYLNLGIARGDGLIMASALSEDSILYTSETPWFMRMQKSRTFSLGSYQIGKASNQPCVVYGMPLPDQPADQPLAAIFVAINLEALQKCISRPRLPNKTVIVVLDRNGTELARNPDSSKWIGHQANSWPLYKARIGRQNGYVETTGIDGILRRYHYVPVPGSDNGLFVNVGMAKEVILERINADFHQNLLWLGLSALAALGCAWVVAGYSVLKYVQRLTVAARRMARGEWSTRVQLQGNASWELHELATAFDEMAAALRQNQDWLEEKVEQRTQQLSRSNESLQAEILERKQAEKASRKLLHDLERSNKELEQFAYVASHDLQEPLRLVSAYTQLLLQRYRDKLDADADPIVKFITEGVTRMQQLIQDLLAYSRVSSQTKPLTLSDSQKVFDTALRNLAVTLREHQAEVTHDPLPTLLCEPSQLSHVFQNLIANGVKFHGEAPPCIHIGVRKTEDESAWLFSISDNGIGIDPEYFERIFVIFQRLHSRSKYPGTGIGLAICKRIVEQHRGKIWVESVKGKGSTFFFTIPTNPATL